MTRCSSLCRCVRPAISSSFFFFNDTATTEIYTLSLHDALPISGQRVQQEPPDVGVDPPSLLGRGHDRADRKSTRLNSSHSQISYAVFCLKKKMKILCVALSARSGISRSMCGCCEVPESSTLSGR